MSSTIPSEKGFSSQNIYKQFTNSDRAELSDGRTINYSETTPLSIHSIKKYRRISFSYEAPGKKTQKFNIRVGKNIPLYAQIKDLEKKEKNKQKQNAALKTLIAKYIFAMLNPHFVGTERIRKISAEFSSQGQCNTVLIGDKQIDLTQRRRSKKKQRTIHEKLSNLAKAEKIQKIFNYAMGPLPPRKPGKSPPSRKPIEKIQPRSTSGQNPSIQFLHNFYEGRQAITIQGVGRKTFEQILNMNFYQMETGHDFIQVLFPGNKTSIHNAKAPVLSSNDFKVLKNLPDIEEKITQALNRMVQHWKELEKHLKSKGKSIVEDHNMLRIIRAIKCLHQMEISLSPENLSFFQKTLPKIYNSSSFDQNSRPSFKVALDYYGINVASPTTSFKKKPLPNWSSQANARSARDGTFQKEFKVSQLPDNWTLLIPSKAKSTWDRGKKVALSKDQYDCLAKGVLYREGYTEDFIPNTSETTQFMDNCKKLGKPCNFYKTTSNPITGFLSNFSEVPINYKGNTYKCAEAAFQAQKIHFCTTMSQREKDRFFQEFANASGSEAFEKKQTLENRLDYARESWIKKNESIMEEVLTAKFQNPNLKQLLLSTGDVYLNERPVRDDGSGTVVRGRGFPWTDQEGRDQRGNTLKAKNLLGNLLMQLRQALGGTGKVKKPKNYANESPRPLTLPNGKNIQIQ